VIRLALSSEGPDTAPCGTLVVGMLAGERPPKGEAGWVDWRLGGALSRAILAGRVDGAAGSCVLMPAKKLPCARILVMGLGHPTEAKGRALGAAIDLAREKLAGLGETDFAIALPGDKPTGVPKDAAETIGRHLLIPLAAAARQAKITLLGPTELLNDVREWVRNAGDPVSTHVVLADRVGNEIPAARPGEAGA